MTCCLGAGTGSGQAARLHAFSFPLRYFEVHGLLPDWPAFLDDFQRHWPTDADHTYVDFVRFGTAGNGAAREGSPRWRRMTEERSPGAKSVFHFDVQGSVAKSTHAGIPWLRFIRRVLGDRVHFWPFDGWDVPLGKTTKAGYVNKNGQEVLQATDLPGNDHNQVVYVLRCGSCGHRYGANGSDVWQRKCPACGGGAAGLAF